MGAGIRLTFALPYRNQDEYWTEEQKNLYHSLLLEADEVYYVSENYSMDCMKKRNYHMIDNSAYCICAAIQDNGEITQAFHYAQKRGLHIVNILTR